MNATATSNNFNNIERVDMIYLPRTVTNADLTGFGFALYERGFGDPFRIVGLRGSTAGSCAVPVPTGALVTAVAGNWGPNVLTRRDIISRRDPATQNEMRPDTSLEQPVRGIFFNFSQLGFEDGDTVCGYALFSDDSTGTDPNDPAQNPANTSSAFVLDLLASAGLYSASLPTPANMSVQLNNIPPELLPGQLYPGLGAVCTSTGPGTAIDPICNVEVNVGTIESLVCVPAAAASLAMDDTIVCSFNYRSPDDMTDPEVIITARTNASNDSNPDDNIDVAQRPQTPANMSVQLNNIPPVLSPGQLYPGLQAVCTSTGPGTAIVPICNVEVDAGTIESLVCVPAAAAFLPMGDTIVCSFNYRSPNDLTTPEVTFTARTNASNDSNPDDNADTTVRRLSGPKPIPVGQWWVFVVGLMLATVWYRKKFV